MLAAGQRGLRGDGPNHSVSGLGGVAWSGTGREAWSGLDRVACSGRGDATSAASGWAQARRDERAEVLDRLVEGQAAAPSEGNRRERNGMNLGFHHPLTGTGNSSRLEAGAAAGQAIRSRIWRTRSIEVCGCRKANRATVSPSQADGGMNATWSVSSWAAQRLY